MNALAKSETEMHCKQPNFPREAYDYIDDVTPEAVDEIRQKATPIVDDEEWELIDGFGGITAA